MEPYWTMRKRSDGAGSSIAPYRPAPTAPPLPPRPYRPAPIASMKQP